MAGRAEGRPLKCTVGVMAYNEERNIGRLLEALGRQRTRTCGIDSIMVVASGCTDGTEPITRAAARKDTRIRLMSQAAREGKSRAINLFLREARATGADVCILQSGDTLPEEDTIERLVRPMAESAAVGMTGARVVPVNGKGSYVGRIVHTLWRLHHRLALDSPKAGELVAFRNVVDEIPGDSAVDEVSIESAITSLGLSLRYAPDAIVLNKGPETIADFLKQRRRIHAGHIEVARRFGYAPSTMSLGRVGRHVVADMLETPSEIPACLGAAVLEAVGRALGTYDVYIARKSHAVWDIAVTTKNVQRN